MMRAVLCLLFLVASNYAYSMEMADDPVLTMFKLDKLEQSGLGFGEDTTWDLQAWIGKDLDKLWFKTEGDVTDSHLEQAEAQLLYSRAIVATWDMQIGWRHDLKPSPSRDWLAIGFQGLAPYFFESEVHLFAANNGNVSLRAKLNHDMLLTQKLILTPEIEAEFYSKSDQEVGIGQGLSQTDLGLRLRYEISRKFAPYIGMQWTKQFSDTADFSRQSGEDVSDLQWVLGLRAWW